MEINDRKTWDVRNAARKKKTKTMSGNGSNTKMKCKVLFYVLCGVAVG
jgi:hypothetical protein